MKPQELSNRKEVPAKPEAVSQNQIFYMIFDQAL